MFKVGTDCSGIEAPIQALDKLSNKYNITYSHEFSSENNKYAVECIHGNYTPKILYGDMVDRDIKTLPEIDIYVSGFPCQPFSRANKFKTSVDPRLNLFKNCLDVIFHCRPKVFILENVKTLVSLDNGSYFNDILESLQKDDIYDVNWRVLNSKDYGIPQTRERLYFIGIRKDCLKYEYQFPEKIKMKDLSLFIDDTDNTKIPIKESNKALFNNIPSDSVFIDIGFRNSRFVNSNKWAPCITAQPNMWCVPKQRKANVHEYLQLQGFSNTFKQPNNISDHQMKIRVGNSMTVDVIEKLLEQCFISVGIINLKD
jgi:DNA (cytosine-5)-methyltransferase 1